MSSIEAMTKAGREKLNTARWLEEERKRTAEEQRQEAIQCQWNALTDAVKAFVPAPLLSYVNLTQPRDDDDGEYAYTRPDRDFSTDGKFTKDARGWILCVRIPGYAPIDFACVRYGNDPWIQGRFRRHAHNRLWRVSGYCAEHSRDGMTKYVGTDRDNALLTDDVEEALAFAAEAEQQRQKLQEEVDSYNAERTRKNVERVKREDERPTIEEELADVLRRFVVQYAPSGE